MLSALKPNIFKSKLLGMPFFQKRAKSISSIKNSWESVKSSPSFWMIRHGIRAFQVCIVSVAIFQAGYSTGVVSYATNPEMMGTDLLSSIASEGSEPTEFHDKDHSDHKRVEAIAMNIVTAAKRHCKSEMRAAHIIGKRALQNLDGLQHSIFNKDEIIAIQGKISEAEASYEHWENALKRVEGDWKIHLTKNKKTVNAFVSDVLPRNIFVQQGLLSTLNPTDDELAMIFGHEISHVLLGHSSQELAGNAVAKVMQLVFLSFVDPAGVVSILLECLSFEAAHVFKAYLSRNNEFDADDLGKLILEQASYDPVKGSQIFLKASNAVSKQYSKDASMLSISKLGQLATLYWHESHPDSTLRYKRLNSI